MNTTLPEELMDFHPSVYEAFDSVCVGIEMHTDKVNCCRCYGLTGFNWWCSKCQQMLKNLRVLNKTV